jgi:hypothetical protein
MRSMIAVLSIVGSCAVFAPGQAQAQVCLPGGTLPSLDCSTASECCVSGALSPDGPAPTFLCQDAILWNWRNIGDQCTQASLANHQESFNVEVDPDEDEPYPSSVCDPNTEFARHYTSAYLLGAIKHEPGKTWHRPMEYRMASSAWANDYHPELSHHFAVSRDDDETPNARNRGDDITFYCPLYSEKESGTPVYRASDFIHEAWHSSSYGSHDWGNKKDWYYPYWKGTIPEGELNETFIPSYMPEDAPNKGWCPSLICAPRGMVSVYQVHFEYLCDLATTPADWVPRMLVAQASQTASMLRDSKYRAEGGVFLNHEPIGVDCAAAPKIWRNPWVPSAGKALQVDLRFNAFMFEWDPFPNENDSDTFDTTAILRVSPSRRTDALEINSQVVDGEVWVKLIANAELLADNETVKVRYNVRFYERSGNNLDDCDIDLAGCNCPGGFREIDLGPEDSCLAGGPPCWRPAPVLSNYHMSNECTGEVDANDYANVNLEFSLNWN